MSWTTSVPIRLMATVMALFPVAMATVCHTGLRSVPLSIETPTQPALSFQQYAVDRKKIPPTSIVEASYGFHNRGSTPIRVTMEPSCGCLTPRLEGVRDGVVEPGERGRVVVRMQPANSTPGPHEYTVKVKYVDSEPRETQLTLKLEIPAALWVTPPALIVSHPAGSTPTVADFMVTDGRGKAFEITNVSVNTALVEAVIGESSRSPVGNFQQSVRVSIAGDLPPGNNQVVLRIETDDPDMQELKVPLLLRGPTAANGEKDQALDHEHTKHASRVDPEVVRPRQRSTSAALVEDVPATKVSK